MSYLNKTYKVDKIENYKEVLESLGVPEDQLDVHLNFKPVYSLKKEGDEYTESITTPDCDKVIKFKDGVEFDWDVIPGVVGKFLFTVEGNVITQIEKFGDDVTLTSRREFSGDKMVLVISSNKCPTSARKYFTAV